MDLRHLRYFVAVAENGSFTRAAEQLGIEQPPLSQQIKQFENELGVLLFQRLTRGVRLTDVGVVLMDQAKAILGMQQQFLSIATGLARGERGHLRVGLAGAVSLLPLIPQTVRHFREEWPDVTISLEESNTPALRKALHDRAIDIAIVRPPVPDGGEGLVVSPLLAEPTVVALPKGHELASRPRLELEMLADEPLIIFPRELGPGFHDAILSACQNAGFTPRMGQQAPQIASTVPLVAAGLGISVVPQSLHQIHSGGVTYHSLGPKAPKADLAIAIRAGQHSPLIAHFVAILRDSCRDMQLPEGDGMTSDPPEIT
ncbi:LysR family transcriptional regulator [Novacetimonas hansenii]|uniref:LysR family transcriptional regulator n=1 Tax=Novacetimonas hansenii TaxID=436 RepID=A0AAW5ERX5_NOVHA|nr:LysR family transcriptional regulator [Novacetimonas hansenii]MBL7237032.1 LysR family transcriptional regulator [Novacetimonas hansenii]MCJ8353487.1 LysR family transcriptional regulator [Novacetimonas hansenii]PYD72340.1 LysR family transcriptional regulator [Novacetimonas hansenii]QOF95054.1 LysR family transcriptional regulator [Novacetimonas hansenii]RFP00368.1 LysR family transcriptional regulator [Novacetimonas hansenii]